MSNTPCHRQFSRDVLAAHVTARMRELEEKIDMTPKGSLLTITTARRMELQRLYDHFELGTARPRRKGVTLTRYDT